MPVPDRCPCQPPPGADLAPEYRKWRRVHGFQPPFHPQQLAAWCLLATGIAFTAGVLVPALCQPVKLPVIIVSLLVLLFHGVTHVIATRLDPASAELRARSQRIPVPEFNRNLHAHVIENGRCHLCNITIESHRTKHCSVCNKCVDHFDHHCKWLNHCVGKRNYVWFLVCVASTALLSILILTLSIGEIAILYTRPYLIGACGVCENATNATNYLCPPELAMFSLPVNPAAFIAAAGFFTLVTLLCSVLLLHLFFFHIYIMSRGMTTYEYIRGLSAPSPRPKTSITPPQRCRFLFEVLHKNRVKPSPPVQHKDGDQEKQGNRSGSRISGRASRSGRSSLVSIVSLSLPALATRVVTQRVVTVEDSPSLPPPAEGGKAPGDGQRLDEHVEKEDCKAVVFCNNERAVMEPSTWADLSLGGRATSATIENGHKTFHDSGRHGEDTTVVAKNSRRSAVDLTRPGSAASALKFQRQKTAPDLEIEGFNVRQTRPRMRSIDHTMRTSSSSGRRQEVPSTQWQTASIDDSVQRHGPVDSDVFEKAQASSPKIGEGLDSCNTGDAEEVLRRVE